MISDTRYMLFDICYSILLLDIGYIISNTWYLTPWYLQSKTLIHATCYLPNVHWYLILFTWYQSLLLLAKRLFPFAPVVRLALVLKTLYFWRPNKKVKPSLLWMFSYIKNTLVHAKMWQQWKNSMCTYFIMPQEIT